VVVKLKGGTGSGGWFTVCQRVPAEVGHCDYTLPCNFGWEQAVVHVITIHGGLSAQSAMPIKIARSDVAGLDRHLRSLYSQSDYFQQKPRVFQASVASFDRRTLYNFCSHLACLENTGETLVPEPQAFQDCSEPTPCFNIELTDAEVANIHAAKAAHAVWLDKHSLVPWRLSDFSDADLRGLFNRDLLFDRSPSGYHFISVVDHAPTEGYRYALDNQLIQGGPVDSLYAVLEDLRGHRDHPTFSHGASYYGDPVTAYTLHEALTIYSDRGYGIYRISRNGCHSMARIAVGLLRSINIPGEIATGGEWFDAGHSSAVWPALQRVMPHGDDIYSAGLLEVPVDEFLPMFGIYDHPSYTLICGADRPCISHRHRALLSIAYPAEWVRDRCCQPAQYGHTSCSEYLSSDYGAYLTEEEIAEAAGRIEGLCP
jgi:hypothetical protein